MPARPALLALVRDLEDHLGRVRREVEELDALTPAVDAPPSGERRWAIAGHLHSFYTGLEVVLTRILERFEGPPPGGPDSHVRLLQAAALDVPTFRPAILERETVQALDRYRAFRHFFRHA